MTHSILMKLTRLVFYNKNKEMILFLCLRTNKMLSLRVFVRCESHYHLSMFYMFIMGF